MLIALEDLNSALFLLLDCVWKVFDHKLDQMESTLAQLESASHEMIKGGLLAEDSDVMRQVDYSWLYILPV